MSELATSTIAPPLRAFAALPSERAASLTDKFGRTITYLRLAVTDRCNLRCVYCMPERIQFSRPIEILSFEEMLRLARVTAQMGVNKVRITGGEPFVRADIMRFLWRLRETEGIDEISLTTNGVLTAPFMGELSELGIASINLSIDSFDRERFRILTRRDEFPAVERSFYAALERGIPLKINAVVMDGKNTDDIIPLALLTKTHPVETRFIEEMPFNGQTTGLSGGALSLLWNHKKILAALKEAFPDIRRLESDIHSTSERYAITGHKGAVGIIAGFSRTFCGACNRVRITAKGALKVCLYDGGVVDLKKMLREGCDDDALRAAIQTGVAGRFANGFEAEAHTRKQVSAPASMSAIGG